MEKIELDNDWLNQIDAEKAKKEYQQPYSTIGALYVGSYYYEHVFWAVRIPVFFGRVNLNPFDSLVDMPPEIKKALANNADKLKEFLSLFSECLDYGTGIDVLEGASSIDFVKNLFKAGDQQLRSCVTLLLEDRPNPRSRESARMASEMFLKGFIALKSGLTDQEARQISHNLDIALDICLSVDLTSNLGLIRGKLNCFPTIGERYEGTHPTKNEIWNAYRVSQFIASTITREHTGTNSATSFSKR